VCPCVVFGVTWHHTHLHARTQTHVRTHAHTEQTRTDAVYKLKAWGFLDAGNGTVSIMGDTALACHVHVGEGRARA
jgi:hypothetical protein